jgi:GT2 family glycosyltransferase
MPQLSLFIGIPAQDWVWTESVRAMMQLQLPGAPAICYMTRGTYVAEKRNLIVQEFLSSPCEWLLQLDSDMAPPHDLAMKLLAARKDVIGALYFQRQAPYQALAGWEVTTADAPQRVQPRTGIQRVEWCATGALLVHRRVFQRITAPWFEHAADVGMLEDLDFMRKCRLAGIDRWCHSDVICDHLGVAAVNDSTPGR